MRFFVDRNLGKRFGQQLRDSGVDVVLLDELFPQNVSDVAWIQTVGERGWVALTRDSAIGRNVLELMAVAAANLRLIVIVGGQAKTDMLADNFINTQARITRFCRHEPAPFVAKLRLPAANKRALGKPGSIEMYKDDRALAALLQQGKG
jgi:predicted nuclease of predicted toxin-antitoxin system